MAGWKARTNPLSYGGTPYITYLTPNFPMSSLSSVNTELCFVRSLLLFCLGRGIEPKVCPTFDVIVAVDFSAKGAGCTLNEFRHFLNSLKYLPTYLPRHQEGLTDFMRLCALNTRLKIIKLYWFYLN